MNKKSTPCKHECKFKLFLSRPAIGCFQKFFNIPFLIWSQMFVFNLSHPIDKFGFNL